MTNKTPAWRRYLTFWRTPVTRDVDDELRFHTNMRVKEFMDRGLSEDAAQGSDVIRLVMRQGVLLGGIGVLFGGVVAFLAAQRIEPMLFRVSARDPFVFTLVIVTMLAVAVMASFIPARRAALVDPKIALRSE